MPTAAGTPSLLEQYHWRILSLREGTQYPMHTQEYQVAGFPIDNSVHLDNSSQKKVCVCNLCVEPVCFQRYVFLNAPRCCWM